MPKLGQPVSLQFIAIEAVSVFVVCDLPRQICDILNKPNENQPEERSISSAESDSETESEDEDREDEYEFDERLKAMCSSLRNYLAGSIPSVFHDAVCNAIFVRFRIVMGPMVENGYIANGMSAEAKLFRVTVKTFNAALSSLREISRIGAFGIPPVMQRLIKYPYFEFLGNLRMLDTRGWTDYCEYYCQLDRDLWNSTRLEVFIHHNQSTNRILHLLASCTRLHTLDVEGSEEVSDQSIGILCEMGALHTVNLTGTSVTWHGYFDLLLNMPQLQVLGAMENAEIAWALNKVCQYRTADMPKLQLRKYCSDTYITSEQIGSIISHCPNLQHIALRRVWCDMRVMSQLTELNTLELGSCTFRSNYMCDFLKQSGSKLSALSLSGLEELGVRDLLNVSNWCPNLQVLRIRSYRFYRELQGDIQCTATEAAQMFQNVRELDVNANMGLKLLEFLLVTCVHVEAIKITVHEEYLTNAFLEQVLTKNPMPRLKKFGIIPGSDDNRYTSNLSVVIARKLVENCNDFEQLLGKLEWLGSSADVWAAYRNELRAKNVEVPLFRDMDSNGVDRNRYFIN